MTDRLLCRIPMYGDRRMYTVPDIEYDLRCQLNCEDMEIKMTILDRDEHRFLWVKCEDLRTLWGNWMQIKLMDKEERFTDDMILGYWQDELGGNTLTWDDAEPDWEYIAEHPKENYLYD